MGDWETYPYLPHLPIPQKGNEGTLMHLILLKKLWVMQSLLKVGRGGF
jgi:hypothetical protein